MDVFCVKPRFPNPPSALRRYQDPEAGSRSLGQSHFLLLESVMPVMQGLHRTLGIYDGRLLIRHTWRHLLLAASTARTSMGAREVMASARSGRSCCLLRWRPVTVVSTGRRLRFGSGARVAGCLWEHCEQSFQIRCPCSPPLRSPQKSLKVLC